MENSVASVAFLVGGWQYLNGLPDEVIGAAAADCSLGLLDLDVDTWDAQRKPAQRKPHPVSRVLYPIRSSSNTA